MSSMISVASGFQYSVNIGYDMGNDEKLINFIPTRSALTLLDEILSSTAPMSTERARILIGAYGKGKSHIVLTILSMLMRRELGLFPKVMEKAQNDARLLHAIESYYDSNRKLLPVVITGSSTSLTQAFLLALQRTLSQNDLLDIMPDTNYEAAVRMIRRWEIEYPETYMQLSQLVGVSVDAFVASLEDYNAEAYKKFEHVYPLLTAGSVFNPFVGFDVVELYEAAAKGIKARGYSGLYVVYDEFSKYLESNIADASVSDTKMLQDFAEKCNRSGENQIHLMLISHKEVANYIDKLPKNKVDGWRGVSERFKHIHLNNNFSQTYEIIGSVIRKNDRWNAFCEMYHDSFDDLRQRYIQHTLFSELSERAFTDSIYQCFPLHPVSTYILPRLSERVAQNERTLFTFLSAEGTSTLRAFLNEYNDDCFRTVSPDMLYDYFEPLFRKEAYEGTIHKTYLLAETILAQLVENSLESKLVKTIALIYILEQFEKLKPTADELISIYRICYSHEEIQAAITLLIEQKYLVYLKRSNSFLQLKQSSGIDIHKRIRDAVEIQRRSVTVKDTLNAVNFDNYIYPSQYNDEKEMTRYYSFEFVENALSLMEVNLQEYIRITASDGIILGILPAEEDNIQDIVMKLIEKSRECRSAIFVVPKSRIVIDDTIRELNAVVSLRDESSGDRILFNEYELIYEDLFEVVKDFLAIYTKPELQKAFYISNGQIAPIVRKAALTKLVSDICYEVFPGTPVISNEVINRNELTGIATTSRSKIIAALLRTELEVNLGLTGTGQEVSIMRSTLVRTGILQNKEGHPELNLHPDDERIANVLKIIEDFIFSAHGTEKVSFSMVYSHLTDEKHGIGLRSGLIPIFLAVVLHEYKQSVLLYDQTNQVPLSADVLLQVNAQPSSFSLVHVAWDTEKEQYIAELANLFSSYVVEAEKNLGPFDFVANAMRRWYMALPRYSREARNNAQGDSLKKSIPLVQSIRQMNNSYQLLFEKLPTTFGYAGFTRNVEDNIRSAKESYDVLVDNLRQHLVAVAKSIYALPMDSAALIAQKSLSSCVIDWLETLDPAAKEQLFPDMTERYLELFASATNDDEALILRLAKLSTGLRIEDWDASTPKVFKEALAQRKQTAENFHASAKETNEAIEENDADGYQITFVEDDGESTIKRFRRIDCSPRAKLLLNQITFAISSMGQSVSEQEKRQVLMDVLKKLC